MKKVFTPIHRSPMQQLMITLYFFLLAVFTVSAQLPPAYTAGHTDAECGLANGELYIASVNSSTGSGSVSTWQWHYTTDPTWTSDISPWYSIFTKVTSLPTGSYYVEVMDGAGTTNRTTDPQVIGDIPSNIIFTTAHTDAECGLANGELWISSVDASTGHGSVYNWRWHYSTDPALEMEVSPWYNLMTKVTNVIAGTYYIEVEDLMGCTKIAPEPEIVGDIPSNIIFTTTHTDAECGLANGELWISSVDASTGHGSVYNWRWHYSTNPAFETDVSPWFALITKVTNLPAGVYYIEVEDLMGCTKIAPEPEIVGDIPSNMIFTTAHTDAECGLANGELWISSVDASTGHGSIYSWRWHYSTDPAFETDVSPWFALTTKVTNLPAGVYYIEVEDEIGCTKIAPDPEIVVSFLPVCKLNWVYSDFLNPVCGKHEINTLNVNVVGGSGKYIFDFNFSNPLWYISTGNSAEILGEGDYPFIFHAEGENGSTIWLTITDAEFPECTSTCEIEIANCKSEVYCSYTQGFYGNPEGMACLPEDAPKSASEIMENAVQSSGNPVLFGLSDNGWNLFSEDIISGNIFKMLPGGSTPASLTPLNGTPVGTFNNLSSWPKVPLSTHKSTLGKILNSLLSQTMTLFFNMETFGDEFKEIAITNPYLVTAATETCGTNLSVPGTTLYHEIPQPVIDFLGNPANGYTPDVRGLFLLANDILGGGIMNIHYEPIMKGKKTEIHWLIAPDDVSKALDAFNSGFDNCRILIGQFDELPVFIAPANEKSNFVIGDSETASKAFSSLKVYPNPFSSELRFEFVSPETVNAQIDLYDLTGRKVKTIFEGPVEGGVRYNAEFKPNEVVSAMYFYRVTLGEAVYNGKVLYKK